MPEQTRISSRLAKKEANHLIKRSVWVTILAIVLIVGFIFVVLPNFIRILNFLTAGDIKPVDEFSFVQAPTLQTLPAATTSEDLTVEGFAGPGNEVILILNGAENGRTTVTEDGTFSLQIKLQKGENVISTYQKTPSETESDVGKTHQVTFDTENPILEVSSPGETASIVGKANKNLVVSGKVSEQAEVFVNDRRAYLDDKLEFTYTFVLADGDNEIRIKAQDQAGNGAEVVRNVKYQQ